MFGALLLGGLPKRCVLWSWVLGNFCFAAREAFAKTEHSLDLVQLTSRVTSAMNIETSNDDDPFVARCRVVKRHEFGSFAPSASDQHGMQRWHPPEAARSMSYRRSRGHVPPGL